MLNDRIYEVFEIELNIRDHKVKNYIFVVHRVVKNRPDFAQNKFKLGTAMARFTKLHREKYRFTIIR